MTLPTEAVTLAGSGLTFINSYDATVTPAYRTAIIAAENFLQEHFTNQLTASIDFSFSPLSSNTSAENNFNEVDVTYSAYRAALAAHATTTAQQIAVANLPTTDPSGGKGFALPEAYAVMLGLAPQTNDTDDSVTLNSKLAFTFGQDAIGALEHEITEGVFGRTASLGYAETSWNPLDLFRFTASGVRDYTGGSDGVTTYFGIAPNNLSNLPFYNSVSASGRFDGNDLGDWASSVYGDSFGAGGPGSPGVVSATDLEVLEVLGWSPTASSGPFVPAADDYANSLTDTSHPFGQLIVGSSATGALQQAGDHDWFAVKLYSGFTYTITETGHTGGGGTLADPLLNLHDSAGNVVATNDDIVDGTNPDSKIVFTPTTSGTYYVDAGAYADGYAGSYTVAASASASESLPAVYTTAIADVLRSTPTVGAAAGQAASAIIQGLTAGNLTQAQGIADVVQAAQGTTTVANMAYQFFTGSTPTAAGLDYLVSATGSNPDNLNSGYYQTFNVENRFINFAVNLGADGAGESAFNTAYGALSLSDALTKAYTQIFGSAPTADKVSTLLNTMVPDGLGGSETRAQYFAFYGGDGLNGLGTKAAMVGWLMAEAATSNLGDYALSNQAYLTSVATGGTIGVNLIGQFDQPSYHYTGP